MRFNISVDIQGSVFCFTLIDPDLTIFSGLSPDFIDKFENVLCQLKSDTETIILGDFNIFMKNNNNSLGISFTNIILCLLPLVVLLIFLQHYIIL
jgi:hypothetical protein